MNKDQLQSLAEGAGINSVLPGMTEDDQARLINYVIQNNKLKTDLISDGFHTFAELYDHRVELFITLARLISITPAFADGIPVWRSFKHSDGSSFAEWFILGINFEDGKQMTYHIPFEKWAECWFAAELPIAPAFDGHTSSDVIERLKTII